jgi:hypothetical protein
MCPVMITYLLLGKFNLLVKVGLRVFVLLS